MKLLLTLFCALLTFLPTARSASGLPSYAISEKLTGQVRVWGSPADGQLLKSWAARFTELQPQVHIEITLHGPESTMAGIYTGKADLALLAREMRLPVESMAFEWVKLYKPSTVEVATAGVRTSRPAANLVLFVNRANPLEKITLTQAAAIFSADPALAKPIRVWGELGLAGSWAGSAIKPIGLAIDSTDAIYFRRAVLRNNFKWNASLQEFDQASDAIIALKSEKYGIAFAPLGTSDDAVKPLAIAEGPDAPYIELNEDTARDRSYPLTRAVTIAYDRKPGAALAPPVKGFLDFILSAEGQALVERDNAYLSLNAAIAAKQSSLLESEK